MPDFPITLEQLTGQCSDDTQRACMGTLAHPSVIADLQALQRDASVAGFSLTIASGYRSFERQLSIWNEKASGLRPVLDAHGEPLDIEHLCDDELLYAILRWSALPGASRHHWGTDFDIYDSAAVPEGYRVQLTESESAGGGPFAPMHDWLDEQMASGRSHGFFRPYNQAKPPQQPGVNAERWHISHRPTSEKFLAAINKEQLCHFYQSSPSIKLSEAVVNNFDTLFEHYICC